ncbi:MAG: amino acid ABC transporter permease [Armatimonadota bacterium]|nr:amino acid ABC transporter permease [Armatimonadota bacterium]MDR7485798.1 amino acid ABC transporter permease [Armatimonadota bacterium]MDR7532094.1 amino acid ABC transporter permease [Armatimonadota bacterium]MDR7537510.1 amino acid ABC transporter permease [Armatimonadota bacterium]
MATPAVTLPPRQRPSALEWAQRNLFDGWVNTVLTLVTLGAVVWAAGALWRWAEGAHWDVVTRNLRLWLVGLLPLSQLWRAWWAGGLVVAAAALTAAGAAARVRPRTLAALWAGTLVAVAWLFSPIRLDQMGGLSLTLLLAAVSIAASFPVGVVVGIGRTSQLPAIRWFCTAYIEGIRGIPLITVLLWFSIFVSLLSGETVPRVMRAMIGMTIFSSAYVGEIMRAGIQSVGRGQVEAARAVGLSGWQTMRLVVLPQAFKNMIPALVGQFISLFKDTSLTVIIGLSDLLGVGRSLLALTEYLHDVREVYVFALVVYFVFSYAMSHASRVLERRLGLGER